MADLVTPAPASIITPSATPDPKGTPTPDPKAIAPAEWLKTNGIDEADHAGLSKFADVKSLAKSYRELEKSRGNATAVPGADAKPEEWDAFYAKAGRPEAPDKYELKKPEFKGLDYSLPEPVEKGFRDVAHKAGLNPRQAQALMDWWGTEQTKYMQDLVKVADGERETLTKEWGDKYDTNFKGAVAGFKALVGSEHQGLRDLLKTTGMDTHPAVIKFFKSLNDQFNEGKVETGEDAGVTGDEKAAIEKQIEDKRAEFNKLSRVERELQGERFGNEMQALYKKLYPGNE